MTVAQRLLDLGHYGSPVIQAVSGRLQKDWKMFVEALETRTQVINMSLHFHVKSEEVRIHHF